MLTQKQLYLLGLFQKNIYREHSYKEIKAYSKEKSNSVIQRATRQFKKENLVFEKQVGTSKLYSLNQANDKVFVYLELLSQEKLSPLLKKSIEIIRQELSSFTFYSLVVFGSYAEGKANEMSDLDLAVFVPDPVQKKELEISLHSANNKSLIKIDYHIITETELMEMLTVKYENVGKEIWRKNLPIYNSLLFYRIINKLISNGFNPLS
jgi:predicted nucleotidyltransferase